GAQIPLAVPSVFLDVFLQLPRFGEATLRKSRVLARARQFSELPEHVIKKECEPDAFAATFFPHQVIAVGPIYRAHQRQTVYAKFQTMLDRAYAVLVESCRFLGAIWQIVIRFLFRHDGARLEERDLFVEHARVADTGDVAASDVRQPEIIIGKMGV